MPREHTPARVLVIDDDTEITRVVSYQLGEEGCVVTAVHDGSDGLNTALREQFDVVVLDLSLPTLGGLEICKELRRAKPAQAIIMLTGRGEELDRVLGLELGADDYLTKPFSGRELAARVKALLRRVRREQPASWEQRAGEPPPDVLNFDRLAIDLKQRLVRVDGRNIELTTTEFDILTFLASSPGTVFSREELLQEVWGYATAGYERSVTTLVSRLRNKIERDPDNPFFIQTVWGVGYRFTPTGPEKND